MKKIISILLMITLVFTLLVGCGETDNDKPDESKISVVTTIFPEYDWVKEITKGNENIELTMLLDDGVDLHSFQPTADDIVKLSTCDMFIYVGGESDEWVKDALSEATNSDMVVINLLEVLGDNVKEEEFVEGMESEEGGEEAEEEEEIEYDEHVWLSLKNAKILCQFISDELGKIDEGNKALYEENVKNYIAELDVLDKDYEKTVSNAATKTILFGDRFPFRYMVEDYGLKYYAAFVGCSAESEASFETIKFLANKVDELGLKAILQIESADGKIAETIKNATKNKNQEILTLDSMQSVTANDVANGATYIGTMNSNLAVLENVII